MSLRTAVHPSTQLQHYAIYSCDSVLIFLNPFRLTSVTWRKGLRVFQPFKNSFLGVQIRRFFEVFGHFAFILNFKFFSGKLTIQGGLWCRNLCWCISKFVSAVMASFVPNVFESPSQFRIALTSGVCSFNIPSVMAFTLRYPKCVFCTLLNPLLSICLFPPFGLSLNMTNSHIAGSGTAFNLPRLAVLFSSTFSVSGRTNRTLSFCLEPVAVIAVSAGFLSPLLRKRVRKFLELERLGSFAKPSARVPISKAKISYAIYTL